MSGRRLRACVVCGVLAIDKPGAYCARFPSDENRCRDWIRAIGREDLVHVPIEKLNLLRFICGEHFDRRDFNEKGNRLKKYAIPKINLTACPLSENQLIGFPQHIDTEQSTHSGNKQEQIPETSNASGDPRPETTQQLQTTVPINEERNEYFELLRLEQCAIIPNTEDFECSGCMDQCAARAGVVLHECLHAFCRECLSAAVRNCKEPTIPCLTTGCRGKLQEREIRGLLTREEHERWLARGLALAESGAQEAFHCRTADCGGWALCEPGVLHFPCQVCRRVNCVPCQAIHKGETCEQYRNAATAEYLAGSSDAKTQALIGKLVRRGEAMLCPQCRILITKKVGCDWIQCTACKTEICWVTRGPRWGPAGRGDTSAGCRCRVGGKRCHPKCKYCH